MSMSGVQTEYELSVSRAVSHILYSMWISLLLWFSRGDSDMSMSPSGWMQTSAGFGARVEKTKMHMLSRQVFRNKSYEHQLNGPSRLLRGVVWDEAHSHLQASR